MTTARSSFSGPYRCRSATRPRRWPPAYSRKNARRCRMRSRSTLKAGSRSPAAACGCGPPTDGLAVRLRRPFFKSEQQLIEPLQADGFPAGKRLGVTDAHELTPESGAVADQVDHARPALGLVFDELGTKRLEG